MRVLVPVGGRADVGRPVPAVPAECKAGAGPGAAGRSGLLWGERAPHFLGPGGLWQLPRVWQVPSGHPAPRCPPLRRSPELGRLGAAALPLQIRCAKGGAPPLPAVARVAEGGPREGSGEGRGSDARSPPAPLLGALRRPRTRLPTKRPPVPSHGPWRGLRSPGSALAGHLGGPCPPRERAHLLGTARSPRPGRSRATPARSKSQSLGARGRPK